ncbi:MAG: family 20 glycosylhydrolase [Bacteroidota bacterium]
MRKLLTLSGLILLLAACDQSTSLVQKRLALEVIPVPDLIQLEAQALALSARSQIFTSDPNVAPLTELFAGELQSVTGIQIPTGHEQGDRADLIFSLDSTLPSEAFKIRIQEVVDIRGGSYQALAMAKTTLLQLVEVEGGRLLFPVGVIEDQPDVPFRGLMIDLARQWHEVETLKQLIDLAAFYKINYVQLHFTDYQSYTLPSKHFPKLSTPGRHYSFVQLEELEAYSQVRGVTLIPEIDVPGHSSPFVQQYPEIFAIADTAQNPWIINMGKEAVYVGLDSLIGELTEIFRASPYFHIGGDEAIFTSVMDDPDVQAYMDEKKLGNDVHELYRHFLVRLNEIVKRHGKQMCAWEGFRPEGQVDIPKDIIVFEFETNRYLPDQLVADGYSVVNTSWKPLYVVNQKKWSPETIYSWNMWRWENWWSKAPSFTPIQVKKSPLVIGAQMCAWEQAATSEIPSLRKRLPVMAERIWNTEERLPYADFMKRLEAQDQRLSLLIGDSRQDSLLVGYEFKE